ncbi:MAG: fasciclin domain-containing protein [Nocardioides sp.]
MKNPQFRRIGAAFVGFGLAASATVVAAGPAGAANPELGTTSLAKVLAADGQKFDDKAKDFDIVEAALYAVLDAKPTSPLRRIANGKTRVTAFLPTDGAFRAFVKDLTGKSVSKESNVLGDVVEIAGSVDVVEAILLYHVVAGKILTSPKVLKADGQAIETALGESFRVNVNKSGVLLKDKDTDDANPSVVMLDINRGNRQVAHGIDKVLRPINL